MKQKQFEQFEKELQALQEKYNIYIHADYEEDVDYTWEEEPYVMGVTAYLAYYDAEGMPIVMEDEIEDEIKEEM